MKYVVLAEKPDQAKKYAHALGQATNEKGAWKVKTDLLDGQVTVVSAVGHLVEIKNPYQNYENWDLANLPAFPVSFEYEVKTDKKKQFNLIKREVNQADCIIIGLEVAQKLYQKGVTSYPRTDHKLITPNEFEVLVNHLNDYQSILGINADLPNRQPRKKYVQDKQMEHYAIIPTENTADVASLEGDEKLLYTEILKRTLLMFAPDYRYQATEVMLDNNGQTFSVKGNVMTSEGWTRLAEKENKDSVLPVYQEGARIATEVQIREDKTKPPARLTESSLIDDVLPKYNLGTPATRAGIIKTIIDRDYITRDKKTGQLFPTDRGKMLVLFLDNLEVMYTNPETTGKWETALQLIGQGQKSKEWFIEQTKKAITAQLEKGAS